MTVPQAGVEISKALSTPRSAKIRNESGPTCSRTYLSSQACRNVIFGRSPRSPGRLHFATGTAIVTAGEPGNDFFVVLDGAASILRPDGFRPIAIGPGSCFGEMSLIDGGDRTATVVATTDVLCLRLARGPFQKMLKNEPVIALALLEEFAGRIRELQARAHLT